MYDMYTQFLQASSTLISIYLEIGRTGTLFTTSSYVKDKFKTYSNCDTDDQITKCTFSFKGTHTIYFNLKLDSMKVFNGFKNVNEEYVNFK